MVALQKNNPEKLVVGDWKSFATRKYLGTARWHLNLV